MQKLWTTRVLVSMILVVCHVQGHGNRPKCGEHAGDANDAYELRTRGRCAFLSVFESSRSPLCRLGMHSCFVQHVFQEELIFKVQSSICPSRVLSTIAILSEPLWMCFVWIVA